jgi:single-stranded-DNA-specific exonuclease
VSLPLKRWIEPRRLDEEDLARFATLRPLAIQLLRRRGVEDLDQAYDFLSCRPGDDDPARLKGLPEAVDRIRQAIDRGERMAVYGDFDADGVTATALLTEVLDALGAQVLPYIPDRVDEGYGLHIDALRELWRRGVRLVVTVDCGIRSLAEVEAASRGLDLIVTDHHRPLEDVPRALAVVNPKQPECSYPFKDFAGVGLAYKLAQGLLRASPPVDLREEALLDLVALGTVADLVPLVGENRSLVQRGLESINGAGRPGIEALMADAGLRRGAVDASAIGFLLGPRINAAGRIDDAMVAYHLLRSQDLLESQELGRKLGELNRRRKQYTEDTFVAAQAQVLDRDPQAFLFLADDPSFPPGIVGLAASRLVEAYYRPSIVVTRGEEESRGSGRSIPEFDITEALDGCRELLIRHGGHAMAAGFTVATANLETLRRRLVETAAAKLADAVLVAALEIDAELPLDRVDETVYALLRQVQPCGQENPEPLLLARDLEVKEVRPAGREQKHLRLVLRDGRGVAWPAMFFRHGYLLDQVPTRVDVVYALEKNTWNGEERLRIQLHDLRPAQPTGA